MNLKNLFLCDAATANPDNTFSVLRGGVYSARLPVKAGTPPDQIPVLKLSLVATIEIDVSETGKQHNFEVLMMDSDGKKLLPEMRGSFQTPQTGSRLYHNVIIELFIRFPAPGDYAFYVNVDGIELGTLTFSVVFS